VGVVNSGGGTWSWRYSAMSKGFINVFVLVSGIRACGVEAGNRNHGVS